MFRRAATSHFQGPDNLRKIKAVIFDWGGVLIDNPARGLIEYCAHSLDVPAGELAGVVHKFEPGFQKGITSEREFWEAVCTELNAPAPKAESLWGDAFKQVYSPKPEVFKIIEWLRQQGFKIGFLSNTEAPAMRHFQRLGYGMFDATVFSCLEGSRKPEKQIYEVVLARLGCEPEQVIFVDDRQDYIDGARALGIKTILFKNPTQLQDELSACLIQMD